MKALVLLSGGIDSATVLWWAKSRGWKLSTLSFLFPGRRKMERKASRALARLSGSRENYEFRIPFVDPPDARAGCYIPQRNLMYYGIAASLAEKTGARFILGGHFRHDGVVFPDAKKSFLKKIEALIRAGGRNSKSIRLVFPFIDEGKKDIIRSGAHLGVPYRHTWSCSRNGARHCWMCKSCRERELGFTEAGVRDPLEKK